MISERETSRANRAKIRDKYGAIYDKLSALFFRFDPIGIAFIDHPNVVDNPDEYEPEVDTILPRLEHCSSEVDCMRIIHEEFSHWFGGDTAGSASHYESIAREVWVLWNDKQLNSIKLQLS